MTTNREALQKIFEAALRETDPEEEKARESRVAKGAPVRRMHCVTTAPAPPASAAVADQPFTTAEPEPVAVAEPTIATTESAPATQPKRRTAEVKTSAAAAYQPDVIVDKAPTGDDEPEYIHQPAREVEPDPVAIPAPTFEDLPEELQESPAAGTASSGSRTRVIIGLAVVAAALGGLVWYFQM